MPRPPHPTKPRSAARPNVSSSIASSGWAPARPTARCAPSPRSSWRNCPRACVAPWCKAKASRRSTGNWPPISNASWSGPPIRSASYLRPTPHRAPPSAATPEWIGWPPRPGGSFFSRRGDSHAVQPAGRKIVAQCGSTGRKTVPPQPRYGAEEPTRRSFLRPVPGLANVARLLPHGGGPWATIFRPSGSAGRLFAGVASGLPIGRTHTDSVPSISLPWQDAAGFVYGEELVGGHIGKLLTGAGGPLHFNRCGGRFPQPEGQRQVARRTVAGAGAHHIPLLARRTLYAHHGADAVAIRLRTGEPHVQPVVAVAAVIAKQVCGAVIGGNQDVEIAVAVEIREGGAARHNGTVERGAHLRAHIRSEERRVGK